MNFKTRLFSGPADITAMIDLVRRFPEDQIHLADLPYRFSSWAFDFLENIRLWEDEAGQLVAWSVLQPPFWMIDYAYHPDHSELQGQILEWAEAQAQQIVDTPSGHPAWFVAVFDDQAERIRALEQAGFASQENVGPDSWSQVWMDHTMFMPDLRPLPAGFEIRPLNGQAEVAEYVVLHQTVFGTKNMTLEWRARTLDQPGYQPDLDLVVTAPDGSLAAFCIFWLGETAEGTRLGTIEPMGVHADYRKLGLGKAILTEGLRRLQAKGAKHISVLTETNFDAAQALYTSAGFQITRKILIYRRNFSA